MNATSPDDRTARPPTSLAGKVALVQGASQGIGRASAVALAAAGATVIVAARRADACEAVAAGIRAGGGDAVACAVDVTDTDSLQRQFDFIAREFGALHVAFNNVGKSFGASPTHETPEERFARSLDVNLTSMFRCMQYEIPLMLDAGGGSIVNMSSIGGTRGFANIQDYCAAKFGVIGLTKAAAIEYAARGIRINAVAPGLVATEMFEVRRREFAAVIDARLAEIPMQHAGRMEDVAATVAWLASDAAAFVTGAVIPIDGGECAR